MNKYGLLLSSNPSKGPFEAGAWQALYQMHIPISCVSGSGLNACNAALIAQGDSQAVFDFWHNGIINSVMQLNADIVHRYITDWTYLSFEAFRDVFNETLSNNGFNIASLRFQLSHLIHEEKLRRSRTELILTVPDAKTLELQPLTIAEIPSGKLIEYILRCAALPAFHQFSDAGQKSSVLSNDVTGQIDRMIETDSTDLLVLDIPDISLRKILKRRDIREKIVKPSIYQEPCSYFDQETADQQMKTGFLDCIKAFDLVSGKKYYLDLKNGRSLLDLFEEVFGKAPQNNDLREKIAAWMDLSEDFDKADCLKSIQKLFKRSTFRKESALALSVLEMTAQKFKVDNSDYYDADTFVSLIFDGIESAFDRHFEAIRATGYRDLLDFLSDDTSLEIMPIPLFLNLYTRILSPTGSISTEVCQKIRDHLLPEDQLALFGIIYLNLMVKIL